MKYLAMVSEPWDYANSKGDNTFELEIIEEFSRIRFVNFSFIKIWCLIVETNDPTLPKYMIFSQRHSDRDGCWNISSINNTLKRYVKKDLSMYYSDKEKSMSGIVSLYLKDSAIYSKLDDLPIGDIKKGFAKFYIPNKENFQIIYNHVNLDKKYITDNLMLFIGTVEGNCNLIFFLENFIENGFSMYETNIKSIHREMKLNQVLTLDEIRKNKFIGNGALELKPIYAKKY